MAAELNPIATQRWQGFNLLFLSIGLISAATLAYEILLMRLLSIIQWHHFAYMIISLALLGYGVSGTFLSFIQHRLSRHFNEFYVANATLFGIASIGCFSVAQHLPFNGLELIWNPRQLGWLIVFYLLLSFPFFFAANCVGAAFIHVQEHIHRVYRWDLVGAGLGSLAIIAFLFIIDPVRCLQLIAITGIISAGLMVFGGSTQYTGCWTIGLCLTLVFLVLWPSPWTELRISQFKGLSNTLEVVGSKIVNERSSPLGLLTVVDNPTIPFRYAPGLSLANSTEPPAQLGVFTDGDGMTVITHFDGSFDTLAYLDDLSSALPYHLLNAPRVLILGAGGGMDVLQALSHQADIVDAVEINPQMVALVRETYGDFAGQIYRHPRVHVHIADARGYLASHQKHYDLIQVALLDSFSTSGAGTHALSENYLYTVEALGEYYRHLTEGGLLAITRWLKLPPRDSLKLFATATAALRRSGITQPGDQLAMIRSWQTSTLLVKKGKFNPTDIDRIRSFSALRSFDVAYFPGISATEVNRYNVLDKAYFHEGAHALLGQNRQDYLTNYKFNLQPATDDRPYFFHFFKWKLVPELVALREQGGLMLLDTGYLILMATLAQAVPISLVLILAPLLMLTRVRFPIQRSWRPALYFLGLGFAFLFMEIAFMQQLVIFVSHPLYATAVTLCGFLVFAGLGSGLSARFRVAKHWLSPVELAVMGIVIMTWAYIVGLPPLLSKGMTLPLLAKALIALLSIAPLAFLMGMPFPLGMNRLAHYTPEFIPWAWGINGCASVLGVILATLIAIHFGFQTVMILAVILYAFSTLIWR